MKATFTYSGKTYSSFNKLRLVQGTEGVDIVLSITDNAGQIYDLSGKTVQLELKDVVSTVNKDISLTLDPDPTTGKATWSIASADVDTPSQFDSEVTISDGSGLTAKFNMGLLTVTEEIV